MLLTRWRPFGDFQSELNGLRSEMDQLFSRYGGPGSDLGYGNGQRRVAGGYPAVDVWQDEEALFVESELPGMELDDLEIYVTAGDQLTIKGQRKRPEVEGGKWHRQERGFGAFHRTLTLPLRVDADHVEASFTHGVLTIRLPKTEEARPRRIEVKG